MRNLYYYMRQWLILHKDKASTVNYESEIKWTPKHIQYKINTCKTWGIDYNDCNNTPILVFMSL